MALMNKSKFGQSQNLVKTAFFGLQLSQILGVAKILISDFIAFGFPTYDIKFC